MIGERKQEENKEDGRRVVKGTQDAVEVDCGGGIDTYIHYMLCIVKVVKSYTKFFFQCEILERFFLAWLVPVLVPRTVVLV